MKKAIFLAAAALTLVGSAAAAQPYGRGYGYDDRYERHRLRDSDRDGIPDVREWNRDRDRDGRPDQYDRYDNRRHGQRHWRGARSHYTQPHYGYGYGYGRGDRYDDRYGSYAYRRW